MTQLCANDLLPDEFLHLIQSHAWPQDALLMAFSPVTVRFEPLTAPPLDFLAQTEQGRIFSPEGELLWRRIADKQRVVYLGISPPPSLPDHSAELSGLSPSQRQLLLWRVHAADFFQGRAALLVEDWRDTAQTPRFSRYHSLIKAKGGK